MERQLKQASAHNCGVPYHLAVNTGKTWDGSGSARANIITLWSHNAAARQLFEMLVKRK